MRKFIPVLWLLLLIIAAPAFSQTDSLSINAVVEKTQKYLESHPTEKVYMHMDKPYYAVGDSIWFKCYVTVDLRQPSSLSKVVYVEVTAKGDSLVSLIKIPVINSVASGFIPLSQNNYQQGNYRIRAYTKWMANIDPSAFFDKTVTIGNGIENKVLTNITYINNGSGKSSKAGATIQYKNDLNAPYVNRKVTWTVQNANGTISKGKGTTDAQGNVNIELADNRTVDMKTASLVTVLDVEAKKTVTRTFPLRNAAANYDVQFFPEGGELIDGVNTKVAFKAIQPNGLGIDIKGTVNDSDGKTVANFTSQHLGMGMFLLTPEANKSYKAIIIFPDGTQSTYALPKSKPTGLTMSINNSDATNLIVKIFANEPYLQSHLGKSIYIVAQSSGVICYAARTTLNKQYVSAALPKDKLKTGTIQVTILSPNGEPLCERMAFVWNNAEMLNVSVASDKPAYTKRQKVKLNILAKSQSTPIDGNFSVSVIDETKTPFDDNAATTILTSLLLQSDVKGYIEKPNYYFTKTDDKKLGDLDLLMLTQGYRHFLYKDILGGKLPPLYFLPESGIELSGTLRTLNGMPIKGGSVRLLIHDKNYSANATTNVDGEFKFPDLVFTDSSAVTLNARNNVRANNLMLMVNNPNFSAPLVLNPNAPDEILNIDSAITPYLQNSKRVYNNSTQLKEVVITSTVIKKVASHIDYPTLSALSSIPDHLVTAAQIGPCNNFLTCMSNRLPGITFDNNVFYITRDYNAGKRTPTQVFVKGMPVDVSYLSSLNSNEIESIEVFLKDDLGTVNRTYNTNGAIVINMHEVEKKRITLAELQQLAPPPYIANLVPKGYAPVKEFYSPKYDVPKSKAPSTDLRTTIYWNPNVVTNKATGTAALEFYSADSKGTYKAVIEGLDKDGNIGRYVYRFKVE